MFLSVIVTMICYTITKLSGKIAVAQQEISITVCWVEKEDVQRDKILEGWMIRQYWYTLERNLGMSNISPFSMHQIF